MVQLLGTQHRCHIQQPGRRYTEQDCGHCPWPVSGNSMKSIMRCVSQSNQDCKQQTWRRSLPPIHQRRSGDSPSVALRPDTAQAQSMRWGRRQPWPQREHPSCQQVQRKGTSEHCKCNPMFNPKKALPEHSARPALIWVRETGSPDPKVHTPLRRNRDEHTTNAQGCGTSGMAVRHSWPRGLTHHPVRS